MEIFKPKNAREGWALESLVRSNGVVGDGCARGLNRSRLGAVVRGDGRSADQEDCKHGSALREPQGAPLRKARAGFVESVHQHGQRKRGEDERHHERR